MAGNLNVTGAEWVAVLSSAVVNASGGGGGVNAAALGVALGWAA